MLIKKVATKTRRSERVESQAKESRLVTAPAARRPSGNIGSLVPLLLHWFGENARDLPWRRTLDPYAIWVSEIMLQQTQVKTVLPYWERWMRELPDVRSLATARADKVLKLWEGLGYYTRVRNLQRAAQKIVAVHGGRFPEKFDDILDLPGIGRYTAGAISSIAFNQPKPILDGNVIRVLTRLFGIRDEPREKRTNQFLWSLAEALVEHATKKKNMVASFANQSLVHSGSCSLLNQSLMELGALICTPRQPRCQECPVRHPCVARRERLTAILPNVGQRATATARRFVAFVLRHKERFLVRQRPGGGVNAHLWEFPNLEMNGDGPGLAEAARLVLGTSPEILTPITTFQHSITRYRISLEAYSAQARGRVVPKGDWLTPTELNALAFTSAHRRILKLILAK